MTDNDKETADTGINWSKKAVKIMSAIAFLVYSGLLIYLTLFAHRFGRNILSRYINIIPLRNIIRFLTSTNPLEVIVINIAGNIVAFVPLGFLLPLITKKADSFRNMLLISVLASFTIESLQYITGTGVTDIDDILLNTLGGLLGYLLYKAVKTGIDGKNKVKKMKKTGTD